MDDQEDPDKPVDLQAEFEDPAMDASWRRAAESQQRRKEATWAHDDQRSRRIAAGAVIAVAAVALWFGLGPEDSYDELRAEIERVDDLNNRPTEGAPQQEVVNGWTTIKYLELLSEQQEQSNNRRDALLLLGLLAGAGAIATRRAVPSS